MRGLINAVLSGLFGGIRRRFSNKGMASSPAFWGVVLAVVLVGIGLPFYLISECSGFSGGAPIVVDCALHGPFFRGLTEFFAGVFFFSAFLAGLPILIYIGAVLFVAALAGGFAARVAGQDKIDKSQFE